MIFEWQSAGEREPVRGRWISGLLQTWELTNVLCQWQICIFIMILLLELTNCAAKINQYLLSSNNSWLISHWIQGKVIWTIHWPLVKIWIFSWPPATLSSPLISCDRRWENIKKGSDEDTSTTNCVISASPRYRADSEKQGCIVVWNQHWNWPKKNRQSWRC